MRKDDLGALLIGAAIPLMFGYVVTGDVVALVMCHAAGLSGVHLLWPEQTK